MTTFYEFQRQFPDDEACLRHIMVRRYGGTEIDCPKCGQHAKFYRLTRDRAYLCQYCKHHIYPCAGTFELWPRVGDGLREGGGVSWGVTKPPGLQARSDTP